MKRSKQMRTLAAVRAAQARETELAIQAAPLAIQAAPLAIQTAPKTLDDAPPTPPKIRLQVGAKVILVQSVLYQTVGGKYLLSRPGHKTLPKGSSGVVMSENGDQLQVKFLAPLQGMMNVSAQEIAAA